MRNGHFYAVNVLDNEGNIREPDFFGVKTTSYSSFGLIESYVFIHLILFWLQVTLFHHEP